METISNWLTRSAKIVIALFIVIAAVLAWFAQNFKIDASAETLLLKNNKLYIQTQLMNKRFSPQEFILVAYQVKDGQALFSDKTFNDLSQMMAEFKKLERVEGVTSILNVPLLSLMPELSPNLNPDDLTWQTQQYPADKMKAVFSDHPLYTDLLVNKKQTATAIQVVFKDNPELSKIQDQITDLKKKVLTDEFSEADQQTVDELTKQAEPLIAQLDKQRQQEIDQIYQIIEPYKQNANLYLGGAHVLGYQLIQIIQSDLVLFGSAIFLVICLLLLILFRQWQWVFIPIFCCAVSVIMTVGLFGMLDMKTTVISSNFIALQLILTLAIVIHLMVEYRQIAQKNKSLSHTELAQKTFLAKFKPCFYAGLTTSVGFASLIFSGIQPVVAFGWMMIVAMLVSISVSLLLFPAWLVVLSPKQKDIQNKWSQKVVSGFAAICEKQKALIFICSIAIVSAGVLGCLKLDVENSFINYFKSTTKTHQELKFIDQEFGGSTPFDLVYRLPQSQQQNDLAITAQGLQSLQIIQHILTQHQAMGNTTSIVNFAALAKQINQGKPLTEYELSVIYNLLDKSLRDELLGAYFDPQTQELRISSRVQDTTEGLDRAELLSDIKQGLADNGIKEDSYTLTNLFVLYQDILQRLFKSQILTLGIVYIALFVVLLLIFRSFKVALIALIPNVISTVAVLGVMGWLNIPLDLMTITISAIAMGIAVDDTIHFTHRYLDEIKQNDPQQAMQKAFNSVGFALLFTTTIITLGFSLLSFSDFVPSILFGLLTGLAMLLALVTDLTLLPALLSKFVKAKQVNKPEVT
ncbi:efflux RND transporter permease subunit [Catenovulum sp. 2E275]|uniref:efflux RND transporter permease subunit n=1 Tax=Catenovulum sp. 2E275 TaxID=2980497 RepID=UPI0021CE8E24|nr:efflux RND transporter permease subunit [Catenovulum sp. 2E275]MCU4676845.1 efflux RND transporter permease subunit [Catenovulum sp. 2E275]